jgi:AcrR family transcriptional regulator
VKKTKSPSARVKSANPSPVRTRIIYAAVAAFLERGYANVSMLDIATRAQISNRDLYAEFENKSALLAYCITSRAQKIKLPEELPAIVDGRSLAMTLVMFGENFLHELSDPEVLLMYYLAIMESWRAPEVGKTIDELGRNATQHALMKLLRQAQAKGLIEDGDAGELAKQYLALLLGDLLLRLLLRVVQRPPRDVLRKQAIDATAAFLALHPSS